MLRECLLSLLWIAIFTEAQQYDTKAKFDQFDPSHRGRGAAPPGKYAVPEPAPSDQPPSWVGSQWTGPTICQL